MQAAIVKSTGAIQGQLPMCRLHGWEEAVLQREMDMVAALEIRREIRQMQYWESESLKACSDV
jgi:hypothetical protein